MSKDELCFHFLVEGRAPQQFFWNLVFAGPSVGEARARLSRYFESEDLTLVEFDEEETKEVDLSALPPAWLKAAQPDFHLVAAGGRIWVGATDPGS
jgi:hypothetical protein